MKTIPSHVHFWLGENKQHFPEYECIFKLSPPRLFIKYRVDLAMFAGYDEFINSIADIQWIDGAPSLREQKQILTDAWNFLGIEERILEGDMEDIENMEDMEFDLL